MKKKLFKSLLIAEINILRECTTKKEKSKLNIKYFDGSSSTSCILGMLFGHADEERSILLAPKRFNNYAAGELKEINIGKLFSVLETYLLFPYVKTSQVEEIISYIKKETNVLTISL